MRLIDADELAKVKFHPLPYTHITPPDLTKTQTEAYERGWNDAIDAIVENAETAQPERCEDCRTLNKTQMLIPQPQRKKGKWMWNEDTFYYYCSECEHIADYSTLYCMDGTFRYCPRCGAEMVKGEDDGRLNQQKSCHTDV